MCVSEGMGGRGVCVCGWVEDVSVNVGMGGRCVCECSGGWEVCVCECKGRG